MGIQLGVNQRSANYLSLIDFLDSIEVVDATPRQNNYGVEILAATSGTNVQAPPNLQQIELVTATAHQLALPEERAALHLLWWQMQSKNIPEDDARAFVIDAIVPMLQGPNKAYELRQIVTDFSEARIEQESTNPNVSPIN